MIDSFQKEIVVYSIYYILYSQNSYAPIILLFILFVCAIMIMMVMGRLASSTALLKHLLKKGYSANRQVEMESREQLKKGSSYVYSK